MTSAIEAEVDELRRENTRLNELIALQKNLLTSVAPTTFFAPSNATSVAPPPPAESKDLKRKAEEESDHLSKKR